MKRWLICGAVILTAVLLLNGEKAAGTDIGKLEPTQVVMIEEGVGTVSISTDVGHWGRGRDLTAALEDMKQGAAGEIFLDTAEYLLLSPLSLNRLGELSELLRNSCQVCLVNGVDDLVSAGEYLTIHKPGITLGNWRKGNYDLPILYMEGDRMKLAYP